VTQAKNIADSIIVCIAFYIAKMVAFWHSDDII
jgi:hypothetical protein